MNWPSRLFYRLFRRRRVIVPPSAPRRLVVLRGGPRDGIVLTVEGYPEEIIVPMVRGHEVQLLSEDHVIGPSVTIESVVYRRSNEYVAS